MLQPQYIISISLMDRDPGTFVARTIVVGNIDGHAVSVMPFPLYSSVCATYSIHFSRLYLRFLIMIGEKYNACHVTFPTLL